MIALLLAGCSGRPASDRTGEETTSLDLGVLLDARNADWVAVQVHSRQPIVPVLDFGLISYGGEPDHDPCMSARVDGAGGEYAFLGREIFASGAPPQWPTVIPTNGAFWGKILSAAPVATHTVLIGFSHKDDFKRHGATTVAWFNATEPFTVDSVSSGSFECLTRLSQYDSKPGGVRETPFVTHADGTSHEFVSRECRLLWMHAEADVSYDASIKTNGSEINEKGSGVFERVLFNGTPTRETVTATLDGRGVAFIAVSLDIPCLIRDNLRPIERGSSPSGTVLPLADPSLSQRPRLIAG